MRNWKTRGLAALTAGACLLLSGCATVVDESVLNTQADYSVSINMPYATATPLPDHLNVPDAIVIDEDGRVSVNDVTAIEGDFQTQQSQQAEYRSLTVGNTGTEVQALQARLQALGYFGGEVTGVYDSATEEAVKRFERTYGTMQTGVATAKLQLKLFAAGAPAYGSEEYDRAVTAQYAVLRAGNVGSSVYALQRRLKELGYPVGELNGVFDAQTASCVAMFYNAYGLAASQVATVSMQQQLYADDALTYNPSVAMPATMDDTQPVGSATQTLEGQAAADSMGTVDGLPEAFLDSGDAQVEQPTAAPEAGDAFDAFAALLDETARQSEGTGAGDAGEDAGADGTELKPGSAAAVVRQIQQRLVSLGYMDASGVTGVYDEMTREAVDRFLLMNGQSSADGVLTLSQQELLLGRSLPRATAVPEQASALSYGDSGAGVLRLQQRLIELGYAAGTADGKYGSATIAAVRAFQQINDLNADGQATQTTLDALYSPGAVSYEDGREKLERIQAEATPVPEVDDTSGVIYFNLAYGSVGNAVKKLQQRLNKLGYLSSKGISSNYDDATVSAVKAYQKAIGLPQTGEASASFQRYIYSDAAPNKSYRLHSSTQSYVALDVGSSGDEVTKLQKRLVTCGVMSSSAAKNSAGTYDEATRQAVAKAQKKMGYSACDGDASIEFQAFLYSKYGTYLQWK